MDCEDCVERLFAFLDAELSSTELREVRAHVEGCDDCGHEFGFEARFLQRLKECCTSDVAPVELRRQVILKMRGESPTTS